MGDTVNSGIKKRLKRNLTAGLLGILAAHVLLLVTLRYQAFLPAYVAKTALCIFPTPIAFGLAIGMISPRRAIAWAPLWSGVFSLLLIAIISTALSRAFINPSERIAWMVAGGVIGLGAGILGQLLAARAFVGRSILAFIALCCLAVIGGAVMLNGQLTSYQQASMGHVLDDVDREYIALSPGMAWQCKRDVGRGVYVLSSTLNGSPIHVYAVPDPAVVDHIEYDHQMDCKPGNDQVAVHNCLMRAGVREELLLGLTQEESGKWIAVIRTTQLTLGPDGRFRMTATMKTPARSTDTSRPL
ncbi:MAG: hypothetical protein ACOX3G_06630 [Armatimonadota bacterium]